MSATSEKKKSRRETRKSDEAATHRGAQISDSGIGRAASALEIVTVRFVNFSAVTSYDAFDTLPSKVDVKVGFTKPRVKAVGTRIAISSTFLLRILPQDGPAALDLRATAELVYAKKADIAIAEHDLEEFARVNAPFNAWAYWREFVQSALARMNLPVVSIPLFRVSEAAGLMIADDHEG